MKTFKNKSVEKDISALLITLYEIDTYNYNSSMRITR